jgi:hypothetical protein
VLYFKLIVEKSGKDERQIEAKPRFDTNLFKPFTLWVTSADKWQFAPVRKAGKIEYPAGAVPRLDIQFFQIYTEWHARH